jgi:hypothetical protein
MRWRSLLHPLEEGLGQAFGSVTIRPQGLSLQENSKTGTVLLRWTVNYCILLGYELISVSIMYIYIH